MPITTASFVLLARYLDEPANQLTHGRKRTFSALTGDFATRTAVFMPQNVDARVEIRWLSSQNVRDLNHGDTPGRRFRDRVKPLVDLLRLFSGSVVICL